ncbi:hypothetical protein GUJ93_ZPchr0006g42064 [Zizania palustris]|uniref:Uncharacterized protein n=1 Tax=Zizania palustris TaxID=103762 RepID=A0A8J5SNC9_ZIZPA|nr:hypothetical protein GUJ93_ZPchr0006g42064 [Zizania palustris]
MCKNLVLIEGVTEVYINFVGYRIRWIPKGGVKKNNPHKPDGSKIDANKATNSNVLEPKDKTKECKDTSNSSKSIKTSKGQNGDPKTDPKGKQQMDSLSELDEGSDDESKVDILDFIGDDSEDDMTMSGYDIQKSKSSKYSVNMVAPTQSSGGTSHQKGVDDFKMSVNEQNLNNTLVLAILPTTTSDFVEVLMTKGKCEGKPMIPDKGEK